MSFWMRCRIWGEIRMRGLDGVDIVWMLCGGG